MENDLKFTPKVTFKPINKGYGPIAPVAARGPEEQDVGLIEHVGAYLTDTLPSRLGTAIAGATYLDDFTASLSPDHNPFEPEPGFNPFEEWKAAGGNPDNLDDYMDMTRRKELAWYQEKKADQEQRQRIIQNDGLTGGAANFILNVATDPTMYFGFGTAQMLSKGMAASRAYAAGAAGGATAYEALNALADPEDANALKSGGVVAASAVMGGLLGKAVDSFGFVQKKMGKSEKFQDFSLRTLADQQNFDASGGVAKNLSAMATPVKDIDYRLGGNRVARVLGKTLSPLSARLRGQTSEYKEIAEFYSEIFGQGGLSKANMEGQAGIVSASENLELLKSEAMSWTRETINTVKKMQKAGHQFTDAEMKASLVLANTASDLSDPALVTQYGEAAVAVAKKHKEFFKRFRDINEAENVPGFQARKNYAPAQIDPERVAQNEDAFVDLTNKILKKQQVKAVEKVAALRSEIAALEKRIAASADDLVKNAMQRRMDELAEEMEDFERLTRLSQEELLEESVTWAQMMKLGSPADIPAVSKSDLLPNRFKARLMDIEDYIDFLHTDPVKLQTSYANTVSPKIALNRVLKGETVEQRMKRFDDDVAGLLKKEKDPKKAAKIEAAHKQAKADIEAALSDMSGDYYKDAYKMFGPVAPYLSMASDGTNVLMLGGQVMAGASEPATIMMHHGVMRGGAPMLRAVAKLISDSEFRKVSRSAAGQFGVGLEVTKALNANRIFDNTMVAADVAGGVQSKLHKASGLFQIANGAAFWDSTMRTAAFVAQQGILVDGMKRMMSGKAGKIEVADLAYLGLDKDMAKRVLEQVKLHPVQHPKFKDLILTNPDAWTDKQAAQAWKIALRRDNQRTLVQPQMGDTPFFWKTPLGANMFKFKNWATGASTKVLLQGVQKANARTAAGAVSIVGLGATVDALLSYSKGGAEALDQYKTEDGNGVSMAEIAWAGINRSGVMGVFPDFGGSAFVNYMFDIDSGGARYHEYKNFEDAFVFGPSIAIAKDVRQALPLPEKGADGMRLPYTDTDGSLRQSSINSMIDLLPLPFVKPYLKEGLDQTVFEGQ